MQQEEVRTSCDVQQTSETSLLKRKTPDTPAEDEQIAKKKATEDHYKRLVNTFSNRTFASKLSTIHGAPSLTHHDANHMFESKKDSNVESVIESKDDDKVKHVKPAESIAARTNQNKSLHRNNQTTMSIYVIRNRNVEISYFKSGELDGEDHAKRLNFIIGWINHRLIRKRSTKEMTGLYIWSEKKSIGKTLLCRVLSLVFESHWWAYSDNEALGWQQGWQEDKNYELIIYNSVNYSDLISFYQIENHGDEIPITVPKRNQRKPTVIKPDTPFMMNSNKPPEKLGFDPKMDMTVWTDRMLVINCSHFKLFPLVDKIKQHFGVEVKKKDPPPEIITSFRID
jgi:hypothetical protein